MIYRNRMTPWHSFLIGMARVFDGLVSVGTAGYFGSSLSFKACAWATKRELLAEQAAQSKVSGNPA